MLTGDKLMVRFIFSLLAMMMFALHISAQQSDTVPKKQSKILNEMLKAISRDTAQVDRMTVIRRNEDKYKVFSGYIIRNIEIIRVPFGGRFPETGKRETNPLVNLANKFHYRSRDETVRKNLFFHEYDTINPFMLADNERYLRDLSYLRDADFKIIPVDASDSADITVVVKDLFSLGGSIRSLGLKVTDVEVREDNFRGNGNAGVVYASYDVDRRNKFSFGGEIIRRNVEGSFINQKIGYQSYYNSVRAPKQENYFYINVNKPLLNRFMKFTYDFSASYGHTTNRYNGDSLYRADYRYQYYQLEGWLGYNMNGKKFSPADESRKLRFLTGARVIAKKYIQKPEIYQKQYNWQFADLSGILGSFTFYRQNFFKTRYVYGFGINEDIPEGLVFTVTTGFTIKEEESRPFVGINFQQYGFLKNENYIDYTLRAEGFLRRKTIEDVNLLASVNYFDHLKHMGDKWQQRFFLSFSASRQINTVLNEPLFLNSRFAIPEFGRDLRGGDVRITTKAESVFFSPWSLAAFRFAPLLSYNATAFAPAGSQIKLYSSIGAGMRTRNESLIFGTIELKGYYFPGGNFYGEKFNLDLTTNVAIRYRSQFLRKPDFIQIN